MEDLLKRGEAAESSLIQSFWYGKFLQCLPPGTARALTTPPGEGAVCPGHPDRESCTGTHQPDSGGGDDRGGGNRNAESGKEQGPGGCREGSDDNRSGATVTLKSVAFDGKPLSHHASIAQQTLRHRQTSLSPNVSDLLTNAGNTDASCAGDASPVFLQQDYTLNWAHIEEHLSQGGCS